MTLAALWTVHFSTNLARRRTVVNPRFRRFVEINLRWIP
jgi:hypothetical protein